MQGVFGEKGEVQAQQKIKAKPECSWEAQDLHWGRELQKRRQHDQDPKFLQRELAIQSWETKPLQTDYRSWWSWGQANADDKWVHLTNRQQDQGGEAAAATGAWEAGVHMQHWQRPRADTKLNTRCVQTRPIDVYRLFQGGSWAATGAVPIGG